MPQWVWFLYVSVSLFIKKWTICFPEWLDHFTFLRATDEPLESLMFKFAFCLVYGWIQISHLKTVLISKPKFQAWGGFESVHFKVRADVVYSLSPSLCSRGSLLGPALGGQGTRWLTVLLPGSWEQTLCGCPAWGREHVAPEALAALSQLIGFF